MLDINKEDHIIRNYETIYRREKQEKKKDCFNLKQNASVKEYSNWA